MAKKDKVGTRVLQGERRCRHDEEAEPGACDEGWGRENLDLDAAQEAGERAHALPSEASPPPPRRRRHRWARMTPPPSRRRLTRRARGARRGSRSDCGQQRGALGDSLASTFQAAYRSTIGSRVAPVVLKLARAPVDSCSYEAVPTITPHARWHCEVTPAFKMSYGRRVRGCSDRLGWLPETSHTSI